MTDPKTIYVRAIDLEMLGIQITHWTGDNPEIRAECKRNAETIRDAFINPRKAVGQVGTMPGTDGFTMACFEADQVPVGTTLFI